MIYYIRDDFKSEDFFSLHLFFSDYRPNVFTVDFSLMFYYLSAK